MKLRLGIAITLIVVCVGFALYCIARLNNGAQELEQALKTAMAAAVNETPDWQVATDEVTRLWQRERGFLHILLPHTNLNELEWAIGALPEYLALGDRELFIEHSVRGLQCLRTIREMERLSLGNIF